VSEPIEPGNLLRSWWQGFQGKNLLIKAAALSYTSVLCLIPLIAVTFTLSSMLMTGMGEHKTDRLIEVMLTRIVPQVELLDESRPGIEAGRGHLPTKQEIRDQVKKFVNSLGSGQVGILGFGSLIFLAGSLLLTVEHSFDDIWNVSRSRPLFRRVGLYALVMVLGLLTLVGAVYFTGRWQASRLGEALGHIPYATSVLDFLLPFVLFWSGSTFLYFCVPNTPVRVRDAVIGGTFGGVLLQSNNFLNLLYVFSISTAQRFYGALGIIPVFLLGLYVSWLIVLAGAQLTAVLGGHGPSSSGEKGAARVSS